MRTRSIIDTVLKPLAAGLAQQNWDKHDLQAYLTRRLPRGYDTTARNLARELILAFPARAAPDAERVARHLQESPAASPIRRFARRTGARADIPVESPAFLPAPAFAMLDLPALSTPQQLAEWLGLPIEQLARFSDLLGLSAKANGSFAPHYRHHLRPKSDGRLRLLEEPKPLLKRLQRRILRGILAQVPPHEAAYGFCTGRSAPMAAARHAGEEVVVGFDLSSFFPSVEMHRVYALFRRLGYPQPVARHLGGLCTALTPACTLATADLAAADALSNRHLPQGAPTSPAIANLVAYGLDVRLAGLARRIGATYTRYADDLSFSGDAGVAPVLQRAVPEIVRENGFALNPTKTRLAPASTRQIVTGIVVNTHLNLARPDYDRLKATIHHLGRPEDPRRADPAFLRHLEGRIAWLEQLNPTRGARLRNRLAEALATSG